MPLYTSTYQYVNSQYHISTKNGNLLKNLDSRSNTKPGRPAPEYRLDRSSICRAGTIAVGFKGGEEDADNVAEVRDEFDSDKLDAESDKLSSSSMYGARSISWRMVLLLVLWRRLMIVPTVNVAIMTW
jgi:hypothetical protein